jgi:hypothetical protein
MLAVWIALAVAVPKLAVLPEGVRQAAQAGAAAEARIVAAHIAAVVDTAGEWVAVDEAAAGIAGPHTAAVVAPEPRTGAEEGVVEGEARRRAPGEGRRIPAEVVATEPPVFRERIVGAAQALQPQKLLLPAPVRRRKGNLSWREEHRVRTADISS